MRDEILYTILKKKLDNFYNNIQYRWFYLTENAGWKKIKDSISERNWYVKFTQYFLIDVIRRFDVSQHAMMTKLYLIHNELH